MLKAVLDLSVFLQWRSVYDDAVGTQTCANLQFGLNVTLDMLIGHVHYTDLVSQSLMGLHAYFQQMSNVDFRALKLCTLQDSEGYFCSLVLQAVEPFPEFLTHVIKAVKNCISSGPTNDILIKQIIWEGLYTSPVMSSYLLEMKIFISGF